MKFSDYFFAPAGRMIGILIGTLIGGVCAIFLWWPYALLIGAAAALLVAVILPFIAYREELPYTRVKETLRKPFLLDRRVRFTVRNGTVGGYFILTEESIVLLSLEQGNHRMELSRSDVKSIQLGEDYSIRIFLNNTKYIRVISAACEEMYSTLRENGWN